jgi:hypothetical protein
VKYGETVAYTGDTPTKAKTAQYSYVFSSWDKPLENITNNCDRYAQYSSSVNQYTVQFVNYDGSVLQTNTVDYGSSAEYAGVKPAKPAADDYSYVFTGWDNPTSAITGDVTATAQFRKADYLDYVLNGAGNGYVVYKNANISLPQTVVIPLEYKGLPVVEIGGSAFKDAGIQHVVVGENVTKIDDEAFSGDSALIDIDLPVTLNAIGVSAFVNCHSLEKITIPSSITTISKTCFGNCSSLKEVNLSSHIEKFEETAFIGCSALTTFEMPSSVKSVGYMCFEGCTNLKSLTINSGMERLEWYCFSGCSSLASVIIPSSVSGVGNYSFFRCSLLSSVTFQGTSSAFQTAAGSYLANIFSSTRVQYVQCSDGKVALS